MAIDDHACDTDLALSLRLLGSGGRASKRQQPPNPPLEPSLTLSLSDEVHGQPAMGKRLSSPHSAVSSFSTTNIKKERVEMGGSDEAEVERGSSRASDEDMDEALAARKKLRLTKEQSALLENRFKEHSSLVPKQKQALAKQLNLQPRQVEVWFQNRRARTKLKQTEVDCEFLRRCCETLTEENRRLQKELHDLKSLPTAALTVCPSCDRISEASGSSGVGTKPESVDGSMFMKASKPRLSPHFFNPFTHSAAC